MSIETTGENVSRETKNIDYLLVGQGLAGSWLAYYLLQEGKKIQVIDQYHALAASNISSGIVNPVTGRRLVKTWKIDTLLPFAKQAYSNLEELLDTRFCYEREVLWLLNSVRDLNNFEGVSSKLGYEQYIGEVKAGKVNRDGVQGLKEGLGYAKVNNALYVDTPKMMSRFRKYLIEAGILEEAVFDCKNLHFLTQKEGIYYQQYTAKKVIFCEGYKGRQNPYFDWLPFNEAKGEFLIIHAPQLKAERHLIKGSAFLVPLGNDLFWVGSTYTWDAIDEVPTTKNKEALIKRLEKVIDVPYTIKTHKAGIRPTTKQRRPFVGIHPKYPQIGIFNGLGTKGVSISPYFAAQFVAYLESGGELEAEVDIRRDWEE